MAGGDTDGGLAPLDPQQRWAPSPGGARGGLGQHLPASGGPHVPPYIPEPTDPSWINPWGCGLTPPAPPGTPTRAATSARQRWGPLPERGWGVSGSRSRNRGTATRRTPVAAGRTWDRGAPRVPSPLRGGGKGAPCGQSDPRPRSPREDPLPLTLHRLGLRFRQSRCRWGPRCRFHCRPQ